MFREIIQIMDIVLKRSQRLAHDKICKKKQLQSKLHFTEQQLVNVTNEMKLKIHHVVEDVEEKVSLSLNRFHKHPCLSTFLF